MSKSRRRKSVVNALTFLIAFVGAVSLVNLIGAKNFIRADLTDNGEYTLSDASKRLVAGLEKPLIVKAYFSGELQPPFHTLEQRVRDLLEEYRVYSKGNLEFDVRNPEGTEDDKDEASGFGINPVRADHVAATRIELRAVYKGVAFVYQDKQEVLPNLKPFDNLEYEFTRAIAKITSDEGKKVIGLLGGHGELIDAQGVDRAFNQIFGEQYEIRKIDVAAGQPIADDVTALLIINPQQIVPERAKFEIDQFLMKGKAVGVFLATQAQDRRFPIPRAQPVITTLEPLLAHYGVEIRRLTILDRVNNTQMLLPTTDGLVIVNNPLAFTTTRLNRDHVLTKDLGGMALPFSSPVVLKDEVKSSDKVEATVLVSTMDGAVARGKLQDTTPEELFKVQPGETTGPFDVAVALSGQFTSFFEGKPIPQANAPASQPADAPDDADRQIISASPAEGGGARLFVMGNGEFLVQQNRMQRTAVIFLQNLVDWLASDEALISIRSRDSNRPLEPLEPGRKRLLTYANVAGVPAAFALFGLLRFAIRRRRRVTLWDDETTSADEEGTA